VFASLGEKYLLKPYPSSGGRASRSPFERGVRVIASHSALKSSKQSSKRFWKYYYSNRSDSSQLCLLDVSPAPSVQVCGTRGRHLKLHSFSTCISDTGSVGVFRFPQSGSGEPGHEPSASHGANWPSYIRGQIYRRGRYGQDFLRL
jgi:hypothetical protein